MDQTQQLDHGFLEWLEHNSRLQYPDTALGRDRIRLCLQGNRLVDTQLFDLGKDGLEGFEIPMNVTDDRAFQLTNLLWNGKI